MAPESASSELHVVLGGTGGVGSAVVAAVVARGKPARVVTRSGAGHVPDDVQRVAADVSRLDEARSACRGATHIYFCVNPPYTRWATEFPPLLEGAIAAARAAGAKLIMADNLYVYPRANQPLTEDMPWDPPSRKGAVRKAMDERLMAAHQSGAIRAVIGRASDFYGPETLNSAVLGERFFSAYLAGKTVSWIGQLDQPHTFSYIKDVGRGLVTLALRDEAVGQAWHIPAEPLTGRQLLDLAFAAGGRRARVREVSGRALSLLGLFNPLLREVAEMAYQFDRPFLMDGSKFTRAFGGAPTPHREAVAATVEWFRARTPGAHADK